MNKIMYLGIMGLLLISCKDEDLRPTPIKLEKKEITIEAKATEVNIKVKPITWRFMGVSVTDSVHNKYNLLDDFSSEPVHGDWFEITKKDNGKYLSIKVDENKEKQRYIRIGLDNGGTGAEFNLIQKGLK